ncbi:MAG: efflux RND transporter permease subunit [Deltaproteobacteria bacterium]|nr:MAG: efflux RND transporter permease subunit [Deltaproteobacteria bacterium]
MTNPTPDASRAPSSRLEAAMARYRFTVTRPVAVFVVFLAAMVFGAFSMGRLPLDLMPDISYPKLTVRTEYPGAAPAEVENDVSRPIEEILGVVTGLTRIESISRAGYSDVILEFAWDADMDEANQDVLEKIDTIAPALPDGAEQPLILRYDPTLDPVLTLGVTGEGKRFDGVEGLKFLRRIADRDIRRLLEPIDGVAAVKVKGGLEEEIVVEVREDDLKRTGVAMATLVQRLADENINLAGGTLRDGRTRYLVRTVNEYRSVEELEGTVIENRDGREIRLRDLADVKSGYADREVITRIDGREAVEVEVYKEADANIVEMAERVRTALRRTVAPRMAEQYGASVQIVSDRSRFIESSIAEVRKTAVVGGLLAVVVLFLFLRDGRTTAIVAVAIPISVLVTFAPMKMAGVSLNIMSLGGLALGIGMLVDNSIVVLESIYRCREEGDDLVRATLRGVAEVGGAVTASTLTTVAVFFPMVFVEGVAGQLFGDLGLSVVFSLLASLAVALFFIPMLASRRAEGVRVGGVRGRLGVLGEMWRSWPAVTDLRRSLGHPHRWRYAVTIVPVVYVLLRFLVHASALLLGKVLSTIAGLAAAVVAGVFTLLRRAGAFVVRPALAAFGGALRLFERSYPPVVAWSLVHPGMVLLATAGTFAVMVFGATRLDTELIPEVHQGEFTAEVALPVGTPLETTDRTMAFAESELRERVPHLARLTTVVGSEPDEAGARERGEHTAKLRFVLGGAIVEQPAEAADGPDAVTGASGRRPRGILRTLRGRGRRGRGRRGPRRIGPDRNVAPVLVEREPLDDPAAAEAEAVAVVREVIDKLPDVTMNISRPVLFSFKTPVEVEVRGYDLDDLAQATELVAERLRRIEGLRDVAGSIRPGSPEIQIEYDRDALARLGLDVRTVAELVRDKVQGNEATQFNQRDRKIPVRVRLANARNLTTEQLRNLVVNPGAAHPVPLSAVAKVTVGRGPNEIRRISQQRVGVVTANLEGMALGSVASAIQAELDALADALPEGVTTALTGQSEEWEVSSRSLLLAMALAVFLVYVIMASQFESLIYPLIILVTVPLAFFGVVVVLWVLDVPVSVVVFLGAIMLAGIVVNNAIVLVDYVGQLKARGYDVHAALVTAGRVRLRPILMTTTTTVLGLLPMALGLGDGAEIRTPMAITVIAGLVFSTGLTLLVIPTLYAVVDRRFGRGPSDAAARLAAEIDAVRAADLAPETDDVARGRSAEEDAP